MKTLNRTQKPLTGAIALVLTAWCLAGCSTTRRSKADPVAASLDAAATRVQAESQDLDATIGALDNLVNNPATDLKQQFQFFSTALDHLTDSADRVQRTEKRFRDKGADYFKEWDKQLAAMNFDSVRSRSGARRTEVSQDFDTISDRYEKDQVVVQPMIAYLHDVKKALETDLTVGGLESVKDIVAHADENARKVQTALGRLAADLSSSSARMSSVVAVTGTPQPAMGSLATSSTGHAWWHFWR